MRELFGGREVEVIDFQDVTSGEHVLEFRDTAWRSNEAVLAISVPDGGSWSDAVVSVNPHRGDVPVTFMIWAIGVAEKKMH
ncbi:hypothetical protein ACFFSW_07635 [Saccharothrix longispora]|uniref:Uncharacterized protein n=2 Tax=Saccharothrix longispora TaxID=33920 RepID=A0ABU1PNX0_9PSEU|nr:hypothetical protein [Saccharothrix longispora]MDR6591774.1 hypothetical protein [Saccharothrix longispora]